MESRLVDEIFKEEEKYQDHLLDEARSIVLDKEGKMKLLFEGERHRVVSKETLKRICLKYRLRFLDLEYFKNEIPQEAEVEVQRLQETYDLKNLNFKIVAPGSLFKLENREKDPILLAEISPEKYLLIHKWGKEFSAMRKIQALPMRNPASMALSIGLVALLFTLLLIPLAGGLNLRWEQFLFGFGVVWMGCMSYAIFLILSQNIFPTSMIWNSKFLD